MKTLELACKDMNSRKHAAADTIYQSKAEKHGYMEKVQTKASLLSQRVSKCM